MLGASGASGAILKQQGYLCKQGATAVEHRTRSHQEPRIATTHSDATRDRGLVLIESLLQLRKAVRQVGLATASVRGTRKDPARPSYEIYDRDRGLSSGTHQARYTRASTA